MTSDMLIGVDIGTQGVKGVLYEAGGECLASAFRPSKLHRPDAATVEENPEYQLASSCRVVRECVRTAGIDRASVAARRAEIDRQVKRELLLLYLGPSVSAVLFAYFASLLVFVKLPAAWATFTAMLLLGTAGGLVFLVQRFISHLKEGKKAQARHQARKKAAREGTGDRKDRPGARAVAQPGKGVAKGRLKGRAPAFGPKRPARSALPPGGSGKGPTKGPAKGGGGSPGPADTSQPPAGKTDEAGAAREGTEGGEGVREAVAATPDGAPKSKKRGGRGTPGVKRKGRKKGPSRAGGASGVEIKKPVGEAGEARAPAASPETASSDSVPEDGSAEPDAGTDRQDRAPPSQEASEPAAGPPAEERPAEAPPQSPPAASDKGDSATG